MSRFGQDLIESARETVEIAAGARPAAKVLDLPAIDIGAIRGRLGLSQDMFARRFGLSAATLRDWEQGRRRPDRTARAFLTAIDRAPEAVARALAGDIG